MHRAVAALLVAALLGSVVAPAGAASGFADGGFAQTGDVEADQVSMRADVAADGDAAWTISYQVRLGDENTTAAFRELQADVRANTSAYTDQFAARMRSTAAVAENATGREMSITNVSVTTRIQQVPTRYGYVVYRFRWTNFAATEGNRLVAGDALAGLYLDAGTSFTVSWPDGYELRSVDPNPDDRGDTYVTWRGERDFGPNQPRVVVAPTSALPIRPAYLALAVVVLLGVAGAALLRRRGAFPLDRSHEHGEAARDTGSGAAAADAAPGDEETAAESTAASGAEAGGGAAEEAEEGEKTEETEPESGGAASETPAELLSPRERVLRLVAERGGRMKQAEVTEELGWSAARTSQVVGQLRDAGELESFRLGRENVLRLPEEDEQFPDSGSVADDADDGGDADDGDGPRNR
ncbi:helix-turn-helix transcriptional regulator [Halobaculum sp. D14]|uniref:helix-turn-helix transcriptional regulator n=1 Tax=Halobaculum sp. D14 TaxID=3421642 RepID=UPI003EBE3387